MEQIREMLHEFGPDRFATYVYAGLGGIAVVSVVAFFLLSWSWIVAIINVFLGFVVWRHLTLQSSHPPLSTGRRWISRREPRVPNTSNLPAVYYLYILGSGGHTSEMLETIRRKFIPQTNAHRRYLVSHGDDDSLRRVAQLETRIFNCLRPSPNPDLTPAQNEEIITPAGTHDAFLIPRARRVHQPLLTAPFSSLRTAIHAINALTREPNDRPASRYHAHFKYPHVIITNGPATGFIVCLVAHLLKIFYLAPQNRLKMVYIESWARSRSLSLTGRLFLWTGLADSFCVQHEGLLKRYPGRGLLFVGKVAARLAPPG
ncbi:glycosyltransferase [Dichotomopilus funicola]|uniref:UDP-N-acetylglucosamine transferase subunit ALG14 n=1 Tax=Dichotomopilus funicola TaxID=1934379 RepID=A0AAN6ZJW7_9PEZI|nr:glycosyltransferase [Dichotomopilus funicola]